MQTYFKLGYDNSLHHMKFHLFLGCLRQQFVSYKNKDKEYPNCTTPWHQELLGLKNYSGSLSPCNRDQNQKLVNKDIKFVKNAATYNVPGCQSKQHTVS